MLKTLQISEYNTITYAHNEIDNTQDILIRKHHIMFGTHNAMENAQNKLIGNIK